MFLFPSLKIPTGFPLIAAAVDVATSAFVMPTRLARSGSISIFICGLSGLQSSLNTEIPGDWRTISMAWDVIARRDRISWLSVRGSVSAWPEMRTSTGVSTGFVCTLSHRDPCSGDLFIELILKRSNQLWSGLLVAHLHNDLRIVGLGRFGGDGKPETRSAAADKTRDGSQ